tara:strand:+ start:2 stop:2359 length:2358 start_codon:yes stop_codon:yes gene_type:complete
MGFLSSLFGGGSKQPITTTNVVSSKLPPEIAPYIKQILTEGQERFEAEKAAGYQPYTGETTAGLSAEQEQALAGLSGLVGTTQPFIDEATQAVRGAADEFTGDTAQQYMSPYQQAVTDIELREAQRKYEGTTLPKLEAQAIGMGGMSGLGSRAGVEMAEAQRSQNQLLADIQAKGSQKAFDKGRDEFNRQQARQREMAGDLSKLGTQTFSSGLAELGALKSAGEERQQLAQSALDEAYFKFLEEKDFPKENLAEFQQLVYGNPLTRQTTTTTQKPQLSTGQNLLNLGVGATNIFGQGGGFGSGFSMANLFSKKEGGGLSDLPVVNRKVPGKAFTLPITPEENRDVKELERINAIEDEVERAKALKIFSLNPLRRDPTKRRQRATAQDAMKKKIKDSNAELLGKLGIKNIGNIKSAKETGINTALGQVGTDTSALAGIQSKYAGERAKINTGGEGIVGNVDTQDPAKVRNIMESLAAYAKGTGEGMKRTRQAKAKEQIANLNAAEKAELARVTAAQAATRGLTKEKVTAGVDAITAKGKIDEKKLTARQANILEQLKSGEVTEAEIAKMPAEAAKEYRDILKLLSDLDKNKALSEQARAKAKAEGKTKLKDLPPGLANHLQASNLSKGYTYKTDTNGAISITDKDNNPLTTKAQIDQTKNFLLSLKSYKSSQYDTGGLISSTEAKLTRLGKELEGETVDKFSETTITFNKANPNTKILLDITSGGGLKFTKDMRENYNKYKGPNAPAGKAIVIEKYAKRIGSNNYTGNEVKYKEIAKQILELEIGL